MANDSIRMSTADLRRRLLTPSAPAAALPEPSVPALGALLRQAPASRLVSPQGRTAAEVPLAEDLLAPFDAPPQQDFPTALPHAATRVTPLEIARPVGRSSHFHPRPVLPQHPQEVAPTRFAEPSPNYDAATEQFRHEGDQLRRENQHLETVMQEMRQLLHEASEQEQRVQTELVDRDARLVTIQERVAELEAIIATKPKTKTELEEWADDLERESFQITQERRTMDQERRQLRDDEESLEKQMRDMEVQMARDRAILARQEQELKRLNAEIQHELEMMQRGDGNLRDRMAVFQRRHADVAAIPSQTPTFGGGVPIAPSTIGNLQTPPPKKNDTTGLLRKLFRGE